jgi:hypothetical protein
MNFILQNVKNDDIGKYDFVGTNSVWQRTLGNGFVKPIQFSYSEFFCLMCIVGGGVQMDPLGTAATEWPIVPAPGDYDDEEIGGMKISRGNRSTQRKPAPAPLCPPEIPLDQTHI